MCDKSVTVEAARIRLRPLRAQAHTMPRFMVTAYWSRAMTATIEGIGQRAS